MVRCRHRGRRWAALDQPRAHVFSRHARPSDAGGDAGSTNRDGLPAVARAEPACSHAATEAALFGLPHADARANFGGTEFGGFRGTDNHSRTLSRELEWRGGPASGSERFTLRRGERAARTAGRFGA